MRYFLLVAGGQLSIFNPQTNSVQSGPTMMNTDRAYLALTNFGDGQVLACSGGTNSCETYSDGIVLVDLTASFGAGKEPTLEWCDANINYFEGTSIIYK